MEIIAESKHLRISPRKAALVASVVRGLSPLKALDKLRFVTKSAAVPMAKTLKSAIANAQSKANLKPEDLKIKRIEVSAGPALKRWRPVSRGRAHPFKKRASHIKVVLEGKA